MHVQFAQWMFSEEEEKYQVPSKAIGVVPLIAPTGYGSVSSRASPLS